jgi:hypothetical protein
MKNYAEKLKANLDKEKGGEKDEFKEELEKNRSLLMSWIRIKTARRITIIK